MRRLLLLGGPCSRTRVVGSSLRASLSAWNRSAGSSTSVNTPISSSMSNSILTQSKESSCPCSRSFRAFTSVPPLPSTGSRRALFLPTAGHLAFRSPPWPTRVRAIDLPPSGGEPARSIRILTHSGRALAASHRSQMALPRVVAACWSALSRTACRSCSALRSTFSSTHAALSKSAGSAVRSASAMRLSSGSARPASSTPMPCACRTSSTARLPARHSALDGCPADGCASALRK
mmetsp:Transcript_30739/g.69346  ORF Transcript_30739/g.69346 Transcript_30739/m.69346 type:complete len:234 (-) Transcript_30739:216-917(-)